MFWLEGEVFGGDGTGKALGITALDIGAFGEGVDPSVVAIDGAEVMLTVTDLTSVFKNLFPAAQAGNGSAVFCSVDVFTEKFMDGLSADIEVDGQLGHGDEIVPVFSDDNVFIGGTELSDHDFLL